MKPLIIALILSLVIFLSLQSNANHIQGGELRIGWLIGNTYRVTLITYYDAVSRATLPNTASPDPFVEVSFFSKKNNTLVRREIIPLTDSTQIRYSGDTVCSKFPALSTVILKYELDISMLPSDFIETTGYYAAFERCCRNTSMKNIVQPGATGMVFYCEFPAVTDTNGAPFINSSPLMAIPGGNLACIYNTYNFNFSAIDPDGDQLKYSLTNPLRGHSSMSSTSPQASPAPYDSVIWVRGFSQKKQIPGLPSLSIDSVTGRLSVYPDSAGLFSYAVKVEEFRNGKKIGEVRREFQLYVRDCPAQAIPGGNLLRDSTYLNDTTIKISYVSRKKVKFRINVKSNKNPNVVLDQDLGVNYFIWAKVLNFDSTQVTITDSNGVRLNRTTRNFSKSFTDYLYLNLNDCLKSDSLHPLKIRIHIKNQICPMPLEGSFIVNLVFPVPKSTKPDVNYSVNQMPASGRYFSVSGSKGKPTSINLKAESFFGSDSARKVTVRVFKKTGPDSAAGILLSARTGLGKVNFPFQYVPDCADVLRGYATLNFVSSVSICQLTDQYDTVSVRINLDIPGPANASVQYRINSLPYAAQNGLIIQRPYKSNNLTIKGLCNNLDSLYLVIKASGYAEPNKNGIVKMTQLKLATDSVNFKPSFSCADSLHPVVFTFYALSSNCLSDTADSVRVVYHIRSNNIAAELSTNLANVNKSNKTVDIQLPPGNPLNFSAFANDMDSTYLHLSVKALNFDPKAFNFKNLDTLGQNHLKLTSAWPTDCNTASLQAMPLKILVSLTDSLCKPVNRDSLLLNIFLTDTLNQEFKTINTLTPNKDLLNDVLTGNSFLPKDDCSGKFESIEIYNRWGRQIFTSQSRDFIWDPEPFPSGVYFCNLTFGGKHKATWLQIIK